MKRIAITTLPTKAGAFTSQNASEIESTISEPSTGSVDLEDFSSVLFRDLLRFLTFRLKEIRADFSLPAFQPLVNLVLNVIRKSGDDSIKLMRAKEFSDRIITCTSNLVKVITRHDELEMVATSVLTMCLRGLSNVAALKSNLSDRHFMSDLDDYSVEEYFPTKSKREN